ncbi:hypothetical protein [Billgrantia endophytica]|uniref:hypothetical protein n=1 Tax=Billgrantia endophytica TaxID=2033802 RepID=UPI001054A925|nr:hypothetical protein [Halomonas endophytica]
MSKLQCTILAIPLIAGITLFGFKFNESQSQREAVDIRQSIAETFNNETYKDADIATVFEIGSIIGSYQIMNRLVEKDEVIVESNKFQEGNNLHNSIVSYNKEYFQVHQVSDKACDIMKKSSKPMEGLYSCEDNTVKIKNIDNKWVYGEGASFPMTKEIVRVYAVNQ